MTAYTMSAGYPPPGVARGALVTAVRIARRYRDRIPTAAQLQMDFQMSRSTAWRWRQALMADHVEERSPVTRGAAP